MSSETIARIRYFKGQLLTAKDFEDQQAYHREKLAQLVKRFPYGIVNGLEVVFSEKDPKDPNKSFDAFEIQEGLAIDADGNAIVVSGLRVDVAEFDENRCYLSLKYTEEAACAVHSLCESPSKNNRIVENVEHRWGRAPNISDSESSRITVAKIRNKKGEDDPEWKKLPENKRSDKYLIIETENPGEPRIRLKAGVVGEEQIADGAVSEKKIRKEAVTSEKLANNAVTAAKLFDGAVTQNKLAPGVQTEPEDLSVTTAKLADNAVTAAKLLDGAVIQDKLAPGVKAFPNGPAGGDLAGSYPNPTIGTSTVTPDKLAPGAVTTAKLADNAVTAAKLLDGAVIQDKLAPGAVTPSQLSIVTIGTTKSFMATAAQPADNPQVDFLDDKFRIPNVVPLTKGVKFSWNFQVERSATGSISYHFKVEPESLGLREYRIDFATLN